MEHNRIFFSDILCGLEVTYSQLLSDVSSTRIVSPVCKHQSFYQVFKHIIVSMLSGVPITLLDGELTDDEVTGLLADETLLSSPEVDIDLRNISSIETLSSSLRQTRKDWRVTLYTSGTTGRPKRVSHSFQTITRNVRTDVSHASDVWGFAYNPTHMAGLQVFFQALFNCNSVIRLFGLSKEAIFSQIDHYGITHISATPTFYRLLLPCEGTFSQVKRITSGGEKFDSKTLKQLQKCFPQAKLTNVYASTEAGTLFASKGDEFTVKPELSHLVRVSNHELWIHQSLLGDSESFVLTDGWYNTGDLVEIVTLSPLTIRFISRKSEMINVGGYKVNPSEVEDVIRQIPNVQDVRVYAKDNRILGKVICCEIVAQSGEPIKETFVRHYLQTRLQEYKIPRLYRFVDHLTVTNSGKLSRQQ